ncbi:hypothetical protein GF359_08655 [candidate division WOR-3 bacterium]|uniref:Uncharacterized protein n=1 Tax=candidate division WOR-3 bacterium TaxID=2052148 RepID=A0A9D5KAT2_UNCW3|nr:hypothetical protein [candidate division WOR-3 bacterium]MBD3365270.1 hypothetical protein [candidate division WOR-3 bacterium]
MRKLFIFSIIILGILGITCEDANYARIEVTNPNGETVAFGGYFRSDLVDSTDVSGSTPATYDVEVDPSGDHVYAGFCKTTVNDTENELKVELYYAGNLKEAKTVKIPLVGWAFVDCEIP